MSPRFQSQTFALLRIVAGFLFLWHGTQKLLGYPPLPPGVQIPAFITYVAGPIELIGGALILLGLFTRWAAFLASGLMAAAYWMGHGTKAPLPVQNGGELAVLYCFVLLFISAHGSGIWSLDSLRGAPAGEAFMTGAPPPGARG
jgi:putative oxidoreductase